METKDGKDQQSRFEYLRRLHAVQDYIESNLQHVLILDELAAVAGFSKFHFHRIYRAMTQESLFQFVSRLKLERAAGLLAHRPEHTITDIAYEMGFSDSAVFSRSFKHHFSISPSEYRKQHSNHCKAQNAFFSYDGGTEAGRREGRTVKVTADVEMKPMDEMKVIYLRYTGAYSGLTLAFPDMLKRLYEFGLKNDVLANEKIKLLTLYHDHHEITHETQLRTSLCMSISDGKALELTEDIGCMTIAGGNYAIGHFEIMADEYQAAWDYMYGKWLPESGFQPRNTYPFEVYVNDPNTHPQRKHRVDIYLPVESLRRL